MGDDDKKNQPRWERRKDSRHGSVYPLAEHTNRPYPANRHGPAVAEFVPRDAPAVPKEPAKKDK